MCSKCVFNGFETFLAKKKCAKAVNEYLIKYFFLINLKLNHNSIEGYLC